MIVSKDRIAGKHEHIYNVDAGSITEVISRHLFTRNLLYSRMMSRMNTLFSKALQTQEIFG